MPISRGIFQVKFSFRQANKQGENPSLFGGEKGIIWGKKRNIWWDKKEKIKVDFVMKELIKEIQKKKKFGIAGCGLSPSFLLCIPLFLP